MNANLLIMLCLAYAGFLFAIAYFSDKASNRRASNWMRSPWVYTLSLSVYCTAWTFYGAIGSAARSGFEFLAIYLGPSIALFAWWVILRKMVRIGRTQNITSIADFISSRFGKSNLIASIVTIISLVAITPYVALQLQSISQSFTVLLPKAADASAHYPGVAIVSAIGLAIFTIIFGTRSANITDRQTGVVMAIAFESVVKIFALICVGIFAVISVGGLPDVFALPEAKRLMELQVFSSRWITLVSISFMAVLVLPRMFHVLVTENSSEAHLLTASWAFPLYLLLLNIFVLPIAIVGMNRFGADANPDYFLISLPIAQGHHWLGALAFIGGFSASTSMVVMSSIAVSLMLSNHIAMPIWLDRRGHNNEQADVSLALIRSRRVAVLIIMGLSFGYFEMAGGSGTLASMGLIAFVGVAQLFPSLMAALFWRGANRNGAALGMISGAIVWIYTLYWPSLGPQAQHLQALIGDGSEGSWLSPRGLFGSRFEDGVVHSVFWSLLINCIFLVLGSLLSFARPFERLLANQYVDILNPHRSASLMQRNFDGRIEDFHFLSERVLGVSETHKFFQTMSDAQGRASDLPVANDEFVAKLERAFSGVVGGAAAHTLISQLTGSRDVPVIETIKLADETVQNIEYARALEIQSKEIERQAQALRAANATLISLDAQRDAFLSQVSHELRTPMTAIRSFTEILRDDPSLEKEERKRMLDIIANENTRLTSMLDEILDLSYLESGRVKMNLEAVLMRKIVSHSIAVTEALWRGAQFKMITKFPQKMLYARCDFDRMSQVFINLITNSVKYAKTKNPELVITVMRRGAMIEIDFTDNGVGVPHHAQTQIFEKFARVGVAEIAGSAGLGLAISREIVENHNGTLELIKTIEGARFRVRLPLESEA